MGFKVPLTLARKKLMAADSKLYRSTDISHHYAFIQADICKQMEKDVQRQRKSTVRETLDVHGKKGERILFNFVYDTFIRHKTVLILYQHQIKKQKEEKKIQDAWSTCHDELSVPVR